MKKLPDMTALTGRPPDLRSAYRMVMDPIWSDAMHPARRCELILVVSGEITLAAEDGRRWTRSAGDLLLVPPGQRHLDQFDPAAAPSLWFSSFEWAALDGYLTWVNNDTLERLSGRTRAEAGRIFERIESDLLGGGEADRAVSASRLHTLLLAMLRDIVFTDGDETGEAARRPRRDIAGEVRRYLRDNYRRTLSLDEIAEALDLSPYYLSHLFHADSGQTLFTYITELRMAQAARRLVETAESIAAISFAVGYQDPNYFSRAFKKHFGRTPSQYRRRRGT